MYILKKDPDILRSPENFSESFLELFYYLNMRYLWRERDARVTYASSTARKKPKALTNSQKTRHPPRPSPVTHVTTGRTIGKIGMLSLPLPTKQNREIPWL